MDDEGRRRASPTTGSRWPTSARSSPGSARRWPCWPAGSRPSLIAGSFLTAATRTGPGHRGRGLSLVLTVSSYLRWRQGPGGHAPRRPAPPPVGRPAAGHRGCIVVAVAVHRAGDGEGLRPAPPGLQAERTELAWVRTALSGAAPGPAVGPEGGDAGRPGAWRWRSAPWWRPRLAACLLAGRPRPAAGQHRAAGRCWRRPWRWPTWWRSPSCSAERGLALAACARRVSPRGRLRGGAWPPPGDGGPARPAGGDADGPPRRGRLPTPPAPGLNRGVTGVPSVGRQAGGDARHAALRARGRAAGDAHPPPPIRARAARSPTPPVPAAAARPGPPGPARAGAHAGPLAAAAP